MKEALFGWMRRREYHLGRFARAVAMMRATKHWQEKQRRRELGRRLIQFIVNVGWDPESSVEEERMSDERGGVEDLGPLLFDSEFYNERSPRADDDEDDTEWATADRAGALDKIATVSDSIRFRCSLAACIWRWQGQANTYHRLAENDGILIWDSDQEDYNDDAKSVAMFGLNQYAQLRAATTLSKYVDTARGEEWEMSGGAETMGLETSRDDEEAMEYMQQKRLTEEIQDGKQGNCCFRSLAAEAGWGSEIVQRSTRR